MLQPTLRPRARSLVAEDDTRVRAMFSTLLRATAGVASVIEAEYGAEAVALARERCLDIAVLDLNMPRLDGVEAALRLRCSRRCRLRFTVQTPSC